MKTDRSRWLQEKALREARADRERFIAWGGEDLFTRFTKFKTRLEQPMNDMTFWTSSRNPHDPQELDDLIKDLEAESERKKKSKQKAKDGAELIYEDDAWLVYHIKTFEASKKYGAGTRWCITGKNLQGENTYGNRYWTSYTEDGIEFYFYIEKNDGEKYALALNTYEEDSYNIFDERDNNIGYIPNGPEVPGLPEVSQERPEYEEDDEDWGDDGDLDDLTDPVPAAPAAYEFEAVDNPYALQFDASSLEDALAQFRDSEMVQQLSDQLYLIKMGDGEERYTVFVFNGEQAGPLMTQVGAQQFALVVFFSADGVLSWAETNLGNLEIQEHSEEEPEELEEGIRLIYTPKKYTETKDIKEEKTTAEISSEEKYWSSVVIASIESILQLDNYFNDTKVAQALKSLKENEIKNLALRVAHSIIDSDFLWADIESFIDDAVFKIAQTYNLNESKLNSKNKAPRIKKGTLGHLNPEHPGDLDDGEPEPIITESIENYKYLRFLK